MKKKYEWIFFTSTNPICVLLGVKKKSGSRNKLHLPPLKVNGSVPFTFYINIRYTIVKDLNRLVIVMVMVFNATFNNISVISWRSVLLMEETGVPEENHRPAASHRQTLSHNVVLSTPHLSEVRTHNVSGDLHWLHI